MPNVALLRRTLEHIEAHPEQWDQSAWRSAWHKPGGEPCGTAYCFAGWAVVLHGGQFAIDPDDGAPLNSMVVPPGADPTDRKQWRHVAGYAAEILGIDRPSFDEDGDLEDIPDLFEGGNSLSDLHEIVNWLCEADDDR